MFWHLHSLRISLSSHRHPHPTAVKLTCISYKSYIIQDKCSTCPRRVYLCKRYWIFIARLKRGTRCIEHYFDFDVCCHQHAPKLHYFVLFKWVFHIFKRTLVDTKLWVELTYIKLIEYVVLIIQYIRNIFHCGNITLLFFWYYFC